jgi:hypothetical protein
MKKTLGILSAASFVCLLAGTAWALTDSTAFTIDKLWFDGATTIYVKPTETLSNSNCPGAGNVNNPACCTNGPTQYVINSTTEETRQRMFQALLAAFLAGKKVSLRVAESTCSGNYPVASGVTVDKDW